jgi:hypothetical protein
VLPGIANRAVVHEEIDRVAVETNLTYGMGSSNRRITFARQAFPPEALQANPAASIPR